MALVVAAEQPDRTVPVPALECVGLLGILTVRLLELEHRGATASGSSARTT